MEVSLLGTAMKNLPVLKSMELTGVQQGSTTGQKALMKGQLKPAVSSWFCMSKSLVNVKVNGNAFQRPGDTPYTMR